MKTNLFKRGLMFMSMLFFVSYVHSQTTVSGSVSDSETQENKLCNIKKKDIFEYIFFCGGLLLFEYLFFQHIILKYDILSNSELKYSIFKNIFPLLHNFISISEDN